MSKILFNLLGYFFRSQGYKNLDVGNLPDAELNFSRALELFEKSKNFSQGFDCQIQLGNIYKISFLMDLAREMFFAALSLAKKKNNINSQVIAMTNIGMLLAIDEKYDEAEQNYEDGLSLAEGNPELKAFVYQNYGVLEQQRQNYQKSADLFNKAIDEYDKVDLIPPQSITYFDLGEVYVSLGEEERAVDAWNNALLIYRRENDDAGIADILLNLGQLQSNDKYIEDAMNINYRLGRDMPYANSCTELALLLSEKGDFENAVSLLNDAIDVGQKLNIPSILVRDYANLALVYKKIGDDVEYKNYADIALSIAQENNDKEMIDDLELSFSFDSDGK